MQNVVKTESLRQAFSLIMEHLEQVAGAEVRIESEYYWSIDAGELYDPYNAPKDLTIGQLSECQAKLDSFAEDPSMVITYGLVWLAELLRAVGLKVVQ